MYVNMCVSVCVPFIDRKTIVLQDIALAKPKSQSWNGKRTNFCIKACRAYYSKEIFKDVNSYFDENVYHCDDLFERSSNHKKRRIPIVIYNLNRKLVSKAKIKKPFSNRKGSLAA